MADKHSPSNKLYPELPPLSDDPSTDEDQEPPVKTTEEEKRGTIPASEQASAAALAGQRAQANPTVPRGPPVKVKKIKSKKPVIKDKKDAPKK